jgi:hypothetical protein
VFVQCRRRHYLPAAWGTRFGGETGKQGGWFCHAAPRLAARPTPPL